MIDTTKTAILIITACELRTGEAIITKNVFNLGFKGNELLNNREGLTAQSCKVTYGETEKPWVFPKEGMPHVSPLLQSTPVGQKAATRSVLCRAQQPNHA